MNQRELASVLFAVLGVFIAASRGPEIVVHLASLTQADSGQSREAGFQTILSIAALAASVLAVLIGISLVFFRDRMASRLFASGTGQLEASRIQAVAFSVLGCYFVVHGLARLLNAVRFEQLDWLGIVQLALGVGLFLGANGLARVWSRISSAQGSAKSVQRAV
jgi:amino acid transporter